MNDKENVQKKFFKKVVTLLTLSHILLLRTERKTFKNIFPKKIFKKCNLSKKVAYIIIKNGEKDVPKYTF